MTLQVVEGVWEELQATHPELKGKRVRVIVLPDTPTPRTLGELYGILKGKAQSSEEDIRAAEIEWEWTGASPEPER